MKNFRSIFFVSMLSLFSITAFSQTDISGKWNTGDQNTLVEIVQQNGVYIGKIISSDNPKVKQGKVILRNVKAKKAGWAGEIYAPRRSEWYDAEISTSGNKLKLKMSVGFISKTVEWTKVDE
jgi:uncharacterized protein (DUF2147 family)